MWNGTEEEFEKILCDYKNALFGTAFSYLNSNSEIDDVVQETSIEFYYKYDTIRDKTKIGAWLSLPVQRFGKDEASFSKRA